MHNTLFRLSGKDLFQNYHIRAAPSAATTHGISGLHNHKTKKKAIKAIMPITRSFASGSRIPPGNRKRKKAITMRVTYLLNPEPGA
ncbi:hypothetical protein [Methanoplanus endosymbiosus]|uniref:Uncharacterized protein n=1 Tax=Methanoplanus endosymbiosus TaxID=33865 RepID=A0A9E7PLX5_9EURY|nr:hypothetical protein [Methanoplanus endosymbiosus]UUX91374.1 hypothetical protein L6E24_08270 [Methanoplanus endosymbiosus]